MPNDYQNNAKAEIYSKHQIQGTLLLAYDVFPKLFDKYVDDSKIALDYGCGTGRSSRYLADMQFNQVDGVDINQAMIETANNLNKFKSNNINYSVINSANINQRKSKYDLIFSTLVFLEIPTLEEMKSVCKDICRVAKFNGTVIIFTVSNDFYQHDWLSIKTQLPKNKKDLQSGDEVFIQLPEVDNLELKDYYWRDEDYREAFQEVGFNVVELVQPKATGDEDIEWVNELEHSPYSIYVLKKDIALKNIKTLAESKDFEQLDNGAWFKVLDTADEVIAPEDQPVPFDTPRPAYTVTEILMPSDTIFEFHKVLSSETFVHHEGCDVTLHLINEEGDYSKVYLGEEHDDAVKQLTIPLGVWFAEEIESKGGYTRFTAKNEPGFHPDAYIPLNNKLQLPSGADFEKLSPVLLKMGNNTLKQQLEISSAVSSDDNAHACVL